MKTDGRKYAIIIALAILTTIFSISFGQAFTTPIEYPQECQQANQYRNTPQKETCENPPEEITCETGTPEFNQWSCEWSCNCWEWYEQENAHNQTIHFYITLTTGILLIVIGMLLPEKQTLNKWVGTGLIIGGVLSVFGATIAYWSELHRIVRPIVIAAQTTLILWITYKKYK